MQCFFKAIIISFSYAKEKEMKITLYENNHCITPYKEKYFFLNMYFFLLYDFSFFFHLRSRSSLLLFNGVLFALKIPKALILLLIEYDVALWLENNESH